MLTNCSEKAAPAPEPKAKTKTIMKNNAITHLRYPVNSLMRLPIFLTALAAVLVVSASLTGCRPPDMTAEFQLALSEAAAGNLESALERSSRCLQAAPDDLDAVTLNNFCQFMLNNDKATTEKVLFSFERSIEQAPNRFDLRYFYGWMLYRNGKYPEALNALEKAYELLPNSVARDNAATRGNLLFLMGRCCVFNNLPRGMRYLQAARVYEPFGEWPELYNSLAILSLHQQNWNQAVVWLETGLRKDPAHPALLRNLAIVYDNYLNDRVKASQCYDLALVAIGASDPAASAAITARLNQIRPR